MKAWLLRIAIWLYRKVKIPKDYIVTTLDRMDADADGYITISEVLSYIKGGMSK